MPPAKKATKKRAAKKAPAKKRKAAKKAPAKKRVAKKATKKQGSQEGSRQEAQGSQEGPRQARRPRSARPPRRRPRRRAKKRPSARPRRRRPRRRRPRSAARRRSARPRRRRPPSGRRSARRASAPPSGAEPEHGKVGGARISRIRALLRSCMRLRRFACGLRSCARLQVVDAGEGFGGAQAGAQAVVRASSCSRSTNAARWSSRRPVVGLVDGHRRAPLAAVREQRVDLAVDVAGRPVRDGRRAPARTTATCRAGAARGRCSGKKCGSRAATMPPTTSRPAARWSGCSRYGRQGSWPRITSGRTSRIAAHSSARVGQVVHELAVDPAQEAHVDGAEDLGRVALLFLAGRHERARGRRRDPTCPSSRRCRCRGAPRRRHPTIWRASRRSRTRCRRGARRSPAPGAAPGGRR